MYIQADIQLKEKAMARTRPVKAPSGRYRPDDKLLALLEALLIRLKNDRSGHIWILVKFSQAKLTWLTELVRVGL
jgi:hypothetical protein